MCVINDAHLHLRVHASLRIHAGLTVSLSVHSCPSVNIEVRPKKASLGGLSLPSNLKGRVKSLKM
jgi:hypothetical protein